MHEQGGNKGVDVPISYAIATHTNAESAQQDHVWHLNKKLSNKICTEGIHTRLNLSTHRCELHVLAETCSQTHLRGNTRVPHKEPDTILDLILDALPRLDIDERKKHAR